MSDETEVTKGALREGDTLRAKFFRWKDRVFKNVDAGAVASLPGGDWVKASSEVTRAKGELLLNPSSKDAYDRAVAGVRQIASSMAALGLPVSPGEPEE